MNSKQNGKVPAYMNAIIKMEKYRSGECLAIYVDHKNDVNELMINLTDAGFIVNYEPRYISENYEGCFLCGEENVIKVCCREHEKKKGI